MLCCATPRHAICCVVVVGRTIKYNSPPPPCISHTWTSLATSGIGQAPPKVDFVPMTPEEFYAHALAAADDEGRLPVSRLIPYWDIFPFEPERLQVVPLREPAFPEKSREDEDPATCVTCAKRDEGVWLDDNWRLRVLEKTGVPLLLMLHPRAHHDLPDLPDDRA